MPSRRRAARLSVAAFVAVMLVAPAAGAQTSSDPEDPVSVSFGEVSVSVLGHPVRVYERPADAPAPETKIGVRVGEEEIGVSHTGGDSELTGDVERPVVDAGLAAACDVARQGDPVTYCETNQ